MKSAPIKPLMSTSDLDNIDVRIGTILAVEDVRIRRRAGAQVVIDVTNSASFEDCACCDVRFRGDRK
jgi:hypothetical protein